MFKRSKLKLCVWAAAFAFTATALATTTAAPPEVSPTLDAEGNLSLRAAVEAALEGNPDLAAFAWDVRATDARVLQAGLRPNPELSLEIEDIRWRPGPTQTTKTRSLGIAMPTTTPTVSWSADRERGARSGFSESEFTLSVSQVIELGGKRARRVALAKREKELVLWDYEAARADVITETARAFVGVLAAQERLVLQDELVVLAEAVARTTSLRVELGEAPPLEANRADVALTTTRVGQQQAALELAAAHARLAATWGSREVAFERAVGRLDELVAVPPVSELAQAIGANPDVARWTAEMAQRDARIALERSRRVPDPNVSLGFRSTGLAEGRSSGFSADTAGAIGWSRARSGYNSDRDNSLVVEFSIPIPIFDRNQGSIAEAEHMASKASAQRRGTELAVHTALVELREAAAAALVEAVALRDDALPMATDTFEKTQQGYRQGKFAYLNVLDAQRTLFELRTAYLDALSQYNNAVTGIERLTGAALAAWERKDEESIHEN
ncbi:MAG: TolC family protein [Nitrospiraceae bacterium]|nr:TolC family protein [Nitrospiraceae bacterium]